jgi:pimeloyl-ACP methyl ester carboxylesterase
VESQCTSGRRHDIKGATYVVESTWHAGGVTLSGRIADPEGQQVATILALHGGGYSAGYWDQRTEPDSSLLVVGAALGYRVLAIDRPGYGASHGLVGEAVRAGAQARILLDLIEQLSADSLPVFVIGHSMGAVVAVHMAASPRGSILAGIDISGLPLGMPEGLVDTESLERLDFLPTSTIEFRRRLFYGPEGTFLPVILEEDATISRPVPAAEIIDAAECDTVTPALATGITVPVQITRADDERSSIGGPEWLDRCGALFTASPRVSLHYQLCSGHNISLHRVARAYHLRAIAFFDECWRRYKGGD